MITLVSRLVLSTWLFVSAFLLPHTVVSSWNTLLVSCLVAAVAFLAFAMPGRPGLRWWIAVLATWLVASVMLLPHAALGTVIHQVVLAMLLAFTSLPAPERWLAHWREEHAR